MPIKLIVRSGQRIILPSRVRFRDNGATPVTAREEMKKGVSGDEVGLREGVNVAGMANPESCLAIKTSDIGATFNKSNV